MSTQTPIPMRPSQAYRHGVEQGRWQADPMQLEVLEELDRIHDELLERENSGFFSRFARRLRRDAPVRGLYLWGGVGRGKTFLVDLFFTHLDLQAKHRIHYHRFMSDVHARIRALGQQSDPLVQIAADYAQRFRVLCLDEFFVTDIGDAMLLARLLESLFAQGVTLVTTSNTAPENLYKDGLQRASFLPAIILLQAHCRVHEMKSQTDYRLRALSPASLWQDAADAKARARLEQSFARLSEGAVDRVENTTLPINARAIPIRKAAGGVVWFDFDALCEGPRSVADYIEIARQFHSVIVSDIPCFDRNSEDAAYRLVLLIDELYDRNVKLLASAAAQPSGLYHGQRFAHAFERTVSRLTEMQSREYLARPHAPQA